jgi:hypothetical protein
VQTILNFLGSPEEISWEYFKLGCDFFPLPPTQFMIYLIVLSYLFCASSSSTPNPQAGEPPLVGCTRLLVQYIRSHHPYLEAVSSIRYLRTWWQETTWHGVRCYTALSNNNWEFCVISYFSIERVPLCLISISGSNMQL